MALNPRFEMYLGKYDRRILDQMYIPTPFNKAEAVKFEQEWNRAYIKNDPNFKVFHQPLHDVEVFEEKFGRNNMILENDFIKKYKGSWHLGMISESM